MLRLKWSELSDKQKVNFKSELWNVYQNTFGIHKANTFEVWASKLTFNVTKKGYLSKRIAYRKN